MSNTVGSLGAGGGEVVALSTATAVSVNRYNGPVILTPTVNCFARFSGSTTVTAFSSGTDQLLVQNGVYKFNVHGYIAGIVASGTGSLYISPTGG